MKVLVTGATGLVGRRLVKRLLEAGHEVVALTRNLDDASINLPVRCVIHEWFPDNGNIDDRALDDVDGVVHLAGESASDGKWSAERREALMRSRIDSTRTLVGAIAARAVEDRPWVMVSASGIGIYGERGDELLSEESAPGDGYLADVCVAWEQEARRVETLGLRWVAMRTGVVLAREGGALPRILPAFRLGVGGRHGTGKQWVSWIHIEDLVSLYIAALEHREYEGPINAVAPHPVTNADFAAALAGALHRRAPVPVPSSLVGLMLGERAGLVLTGQRVASTAATEHGFPYDYPDIAAAFADLCTDLSKVLEQEVWFDLSQDDVFKFFSDAKNLEMITPSFLRFRVVKLPDEGLHEGAIIEYRLRLRGIPIRWRTRIDVWDPPRTFVDTQQKGPYRSWRHTHEFEPLDGGTLVRDTVRYELPFGALGELVAGRGVDRDVALIFAYRRTRLLELLA
ncbi:MAG TPA: TIGR01777 family oxidoreductase [Candidatus Limnocylindrales bacterium]|nr:TIGR01777 family oxidoreductase [Candidatus Limnocylindrales bacterium]